MIEISSMNGTEHKFYFTDLLGRKVIWNGRRVGRLADMAIVEEGGIAYVTHLTVARRFGAPSLLVPWEQVKVFGNREIVVHAERLEDMEGTPLPGVILLKDHVLDKKVIDVEDRDVEVVYDLKLILRHHRLSVSDVNISRYRLLRRLGLKWIAKAFYSLKGGTRDRKIPWSFVTLPPDIGSFRGDVRLKVLKEALEEIHPADLADMLEELDSPQRVAVFNELDPERASDTLEEIDPAVQRDLVSGLKKERVAHLLNEMTPGQAADILSVLPAADTREILQFLRTMDRDDAHKIESILGAQEERIGNFTTTKILKVRQSLTVREAREYFNREGGEADVLMYLYIVDSEDRLRAVMDLRELLKAELPAVLQDVKTDNLITLQPKSTLKDALELFAHYDFRAIPVVDEAGKLLGAVPHRDVVHLKHKFVE